MSDSIIPEFLAKAYTSLAQFSNSLTGLYIQAGKTDNTFVIKAFPSLGEIKGGANDGAEIFTDFDFNATGWAQQNEIQVEMIAFGMEEEEVMLVVKGTCEGNPIRLEFFAEPNLDQEDKAEILV